MTQVEAATGYPRNPEFSDLWPRLLISPVLGLLVANLSGLIDNSRHSAARAPGQLPVLCVRRIRDLDRQPTVLSKGEGLSRVREGALC